MWRKSVENASPTMAIPSECGICEKFYKTFLFCGKSSGNCGKLVIFFQKLQFVIPCFQKVAKIGNEYKKGSISTKQNNFPQPLHHKKRKIFFCGLFS